MFYSGIYFCPFSHVVFVYYNRHLMIKMTLTRKKSDRLGSESRSSCMYGTGLGGFLHGIRLPLGVKLSTDESCNGYVWSVLLNLLYYIIYYVYQPYTIYKGSRINGFNLLMVWKNFKYLTGLTFKIHQWCIQHHIWVIIDLISMIYTDTFIGK